MYNKVQEEVLSGVICAAVSEYVYTELQSYPSDDELRKMYPLPKNGIKRYKKIIKEKKDGMSISLVYLKRASVIALIVISAFFGILMTNTDVRGAVVDTVVTWYEKYIQIDFSKSDGTKEQETDEKSERSFEELEISYIPTGFELVDSIEEKTGREYVYMAETGEYISIGIYSSEKAEVAVDIEEYEYESVKINNEDGHIFYDEEEQMGVLTFGNSRHMVKITAMVTRNEIIRIAENIN